LFPLPAANVTVLPSCSGRSKHSSCLCMMHGDFVLIFYCLPFCLFVLNKLSVCLCLWTAAVRCIFRTQHATKSCHTKHTASFCLTCCTAPHPCLHAVSASLVLHRQQKTVAQHTHVASRVSPIATKCQAAATQPTSP
jgi:hypothetical protein